MSEPERSGGTEDLPVSFPLVLPAIQIAPGLLRFQEANVVALRELWTVIAMCTFCGVCFVLIFVYLPTAYFPRAVLGLGLTIAGLAVVGRALRQQTLRPLRVLDYELSTGACRVRVYRGSGRRSAWTVCPVGEWSIRVRSVELEHVESGRDHVWKGFAAVACVGPHEVPLICSQRRERVLGYLSSLPIDRRYIVEDEVVFRRRGWMSCEFVE